MKVNIRKHAGKSSHRGIQGDPAHRPVILRNACSTMVLLAVLLAVFLAGSALAASDRFSRLLEDIRVFGKGESIEFAFSQPYQGRPAVDHKPGRFSLSFSGTGSTKPIRSLKPMEESIYKGIKVVQNRYSTTVTFELKDSGMSLKDKLDISGEGRVLKLRVAAPSKRAAPSAAAQQGEDLLRQMEKRIAGQGEVAARPAAGVATAAKDAETTESGPLTMGDFTEGEFFSSLVSMVIALTVIIASLYGVLYLYNRFFAGRLRRFAGSHSIRQVASFHIGPRQRIVVLDINGEIVACGVTPGQISYLTHLDGKGPIGMRGAVQGGGNPQPGLPPANPGKDGQDHASAMEAAGQAGPAIKADPVHQFAEVLKQRVRSLKRIN